MLEDEEYEGVTIEQLKFILGILLFGLCLSYLLFLVEVYRKHGRNMKNQLLRFKCKKTTLFDCRMGIEVEETKTKKRSNP